MSRTKSYTLFILGGASVLGIAWLARRRHRERGSLLVWQQVLSKRYGAWTAGQLAAAVRRHSAVLVSEAPLTENPTLRCHLQENILPGLALYRVLLQEHNVCDFQYRRVSNDEDHV